VITNEALLEITVPLFNVADKVIFLVYPAFITSFVFLTVATTP